MKDLPTWNCPFCGAQEKITEKGVQHYGVGHHIIMSLERLKAMNDRESSDYGFNPNQLKLPLDNFPIRSKNGIYSKDKDGQFTFV